MSNENLNIVEIDKDLQIAALQRQVEALKNLLIEKGILINEGERDIGFTPMEEAKFGGTIEAPIDWRFYPSKGQVCLICGGDLSGGLSYCKCEELLKRNEDEHQDANPNDLSDCFEREREIKDDYDYAQDDLNYDAARERRGKRLK